MHLYLYVSFYSMFTRVQRKMSATQYALPPLHHRHHHLQVKYVASCNRLRQRRSFYGVLLLMFCNSITHTISCLSHVLFTSEISPSSTSLPSLHNHPRRKQRPCTLPSRSCTRIPKQQEKIRESTVGIRCFIITVCSSPSSLLSC